MERKRVLIVTQGGDLHADLVVPKLAALGCRPFRINLDEFPRDYELSHWFQQGRPQVTLRHLPSGNCLDGADIGAVWTRKSAEFRYRSDDLSPQEKAYARQETEQALFGLLYGLDCHWMNHPRALRGANWKGEQLKRAMAMGFRVPASLISNSPDAVRAFKRAVGGDIVFKAMSTPTLAADEVADDERIATGLATTLVDDAMMECIDAVAEVACHFQEYIPKRHELRVTVIGKRAYAAKIHSQDDERTRIDSRDMSAEIRYEATRLPESIEKRCLDFVHSYGLNYGALDLIVTPDDEYVFLENNPAGQFLFVEQLVPELPLTDILAAHFANETLCRH